MAAGMSPSPTRAAVFVLVLVGLVHALPVRSAAQKQKVQPGAQATAKQAPLAQYDIGRLPGPVLEMREAILAAVRSGRIEDLTTAIEMNEIKPTFLDGPQADPIAQLKAVSADREGREVLAAIANILDAGYVALPFGRDLENNRIYVWPHFAETGVAGLSPPAEVELYRLVPFNEARRMLDSGRYDGWRIGIGADGVWHFLRR